MAPFGASLSRMADPPKEYGLFTPSKVKNPGAPTIFLPLPDGDIPDWNDYDLHYTNDKSEDVTVDTGEIGTKRTTDATPPKGAKSGRLVAKKKEPAKPKAVLA